MRMKDEAPGASRLRALFALPVVIRAGVYMLAYISREPGVPAIAPTATTEQMEKHSFELWAHEANWHAHGRSHPLRWRPLQ